MPTLGKPSMNRKLGRLVERGLDERVDLYVEQQDGDGGLELVEDEIDVYCSWKRLSTGAGDEDVSHGAKMADRATHVFVFASDAPVNRKHEIRLKLDGTLGRRFRVMSIGGEDVNSAHLKVYAKEVDAN